MRATFTEITDDLTGAADSGSYFTARGQHVTLCTSGDTSLDRERGGLLSINLSSRNTRPEHAYESHFNIMKRLRNSDKDFMMKKIGTGFRGNDPMELKGLLESEPDYLVFVVDHAPDLGTFTLYGNQYCEGEILTKSLYANDPVMPPRESYIPSILGNGSGMKTGLVDIDAVKGGRILEETARRVEEGCRILVFDAITREDTMELIRTLRPVYPRVFWTGSLGIADGLAEYLFGPWQESVFPARDIRCLGVCASAYGIAKKQMEFSREKGLHVTEIDMDSYIEGNDEKVVKHCIDETLEWLTRENTMVAPVVDRYSYKPGTSGKILEAVRRISEKICRSENFDRLTVVGGETSQNVFQVTGTNHLLLGRPLEPGVAQGTILDGVMAGKEFSLKGGSMGMENTLEKMMCRMEVKY